MSNLELNQARALVYQLLSSLFAREIDQQQLRQLTSESAQAFWTQLAGQSEFAGYIDTLVGCLNRLDDERQLLELAADYCGLFLVGSKHSASPYACQYLDEASEPTLFGEQHRQMSEFLKLSRLQVQSDFPEPADHIAVILAYVGHQCGQADDAEQLKIIRSCLANWLVPFVERVAQCDPGQFYTALAGLTQAWVDSEMCWLESEAIQG